MMVLIFSTWLLKRQVEGKAGLIMMAFFIIGITISVGTLRLSGADINHTMMTADDILYDR